MDVRLAVLIGSLVLISCEDESLKREQSEDLNRISDVTSIDISKRPFELKTLEGRLVATYT